MPKGLNKFKCLQTDTLPLEPHPQAAGVSLQYLITRGGDGADVTMALVHLPVGCQPFLHIHEGSDDLIYVLRGKGSIKVEGRDTVALAPGTFVRIPKGVLHTPMDIEQDLLIYNVWSPAIR